MAEAPTPDAPTPDAATPAPEAPPEGTTPDATPETPPEAPPETPLPDPAPAAQTEAPAAPASPDAPSAETPDVPVEDPTREIAAAEPAAPQLPGAEAAPAAPEVPAAAPAVDATPPAPEGLAPPPEGGAPDVPAPLAPAASAPEPAQPTAPGAEPAPETADPPAPPPLTPEEEALLAEIAEKGPEAIPEDILLPAAPEPAPEAAPEPAPEAPPASDTPASDTPASDTEVQPLPAEGTLQDDPSRRVVVGEGGSTLPATPSLTERDESGIPKDRLPAIGDEAAPPDASTRPLDLYARPFENPSAKPTFAVILIDTGEDGLDRAALATLPFPVTFALDPMLPGAADRAQVYRDAGQEVIMLATGLPQGAAASDVEQAFQVLDAALPVAVAVMDLPDRSFQADRPLASLVVPVIGAQGRGVVTWDQGLNAADQVARREDVPATVIFRDLDAGQEATPVIRRYLDRAAFKAAQDGRVTVVGRTRPETVAALLEWTVEGRAATVALAPVSAVLAVD